MNWVTVAAWAFGFFTPLAVALCLCVTIGGIAAFFHLPEYFKFPTDAMWSGGWLFVGVTILGGVIAYQLMP